MGPRRICDGVRSAVSTGVQFAAVLVEAAYEWSVPGPRDRFEDVDGAVVAEDHVGEPPVDGDRHASGRRCPASPAQEAAMSLVEQGHRSRSVDVERGGADRSGALALARALHRTGRRPTPPTRSDHRGSSSRTSGSPGTRRRHPSAGETGSARPRLPTVSSRNPRSPPTGARRSTRTRLRVRRSPPGLLPSAVAARSTQTGSNGIAENAVPPVART